MATQDRNVSIHPYFKVSEGNLNAFRELCEQFVSATVQEPKCLYYGFSFNGDEVYCREGYEGAEGLLSHLANVDSLLKATLKIAKVSRLEIHGVEEELAKLREPLRDLNPTYFVLEYGIRRGNA
jgi:quinol monooxygenase YgiN